VRLGARDIWKTQAVRGAKHLNHRHPIRAVPESPPKGNLRPKSCTVLHRRLHDRSGQSRPQRSRPQGHSLCRIQNTKLKSETRRTIPHNEVIKYVPWLLSRVHARTKRIAQQTQVRADHRILNRLFIFCSSEQVNPHSRRAEVFRR